MVGLSEHEKWVHRYRKTRHFVYLIKQDVPLFPRLFCTTSSDVVNLLIPFIIITLQWLYTDFTRETKLLPFKSRTVKSGHHPGGQSSSFSSPCEHKISPRNTTVKRSPGANSARSLIPPRNSRSHRCACRLVHDCAELLWLKWGLFLNPRYYYSWL